MPLSKLDELREKAKRVRQEVPRLLYWPDAAFADGGVGSIMSRLITNLGEDIKLKHIGIPNKYFSGGW